MTNVPKETSPSTSTSFQPISILKNSKSSGSLRKSKRKVPSLLKKVSIQWNLVCLKIRSLSEDVFTTDEQVEELFDHTDAEETLDRLTKAYRGFSVDEEKFLKDYKQFKDLDSMYRAQHDPLLSEETNTASPERVPLKDFLSYTYGNSNTNDELDNEEDEDYYAVNVPKLKEEFESYLEKIARDGSDSDSSKCTLNDTLNVGESIWEYRRSKWLRKTEKSQSKVDNRLLTQSISHIPPESYPKIYANFIDKGRLLKLNKRLNLSDLIKVINAGWISEEKWDRAAKGLP